MSRNALNLLRSATSSLSTLAVARSYHPAHRTVVVHSRTYSDTTSEKANGAPGDSGGVEKKAEHKQDPVPTLSELETKLKTKEDEVLDLTVRPSRQLIDAATLIDLP